MSTIALDCPHCFRDSMTFEIAGIRQIDTQVGIVSIVCFCRSCQRGIEALLDRPGNYQIFADNLIRTFQSNADFSHAAHLFRVSPARPTAMSPEFVSDEVRRNFLQAERARQRGDLDAAGAMYRKSLDVGTKQKMPGAKGLFAERLRVMNEAGMLTPDIAEWAKHVRLLGNEAVHDPDEPTEEETEDLANLTRMTLIYLFEMPERIKLMRERALEKLSG